MTKQKSRTMTILSKSPVTRLCSKTSICCCLAAKLERVCFPKAGCFIKSVGVFDGLFRRPYE